MISSITVLMNDDFLIYSERVISKKQRRGQTLLRFWQDMMAHEFCCLTYGKLIWRNDGTRNRYISNLCNRNDDLKCYHEYAKELGSQFSVEALLNQIRRFEDFLQSREYNDEALQYRVNGFLCVLLDEGDAVQAVFEKQLRQRSVPVSRFLDFCISANTQLCTTRPELAERMLRAVLSDCQSTVSFRGYPGVCQ